jgi:hypothetical protein
MWRRGTATPAPLAAALLAVGALMTVANAISPLSPERHEP